MNAVAFRRALLALPPSERDAWVDRELGIQAIPDDGTDLPRGCVPYLPCAVDAIVQFVDAARLTERDVVIDVGSGMGRAAVLIHVLSGAHVVGIEVQADLVAASRALVARHALDGISIVHGDASAAPDALASGTAFFLYCPFGGERLARVLATLASIARVRPIRLGCVDLPLPPCRWLTPVADDGALVVYRSLPSTN